MDIKREHLEWSLLGLRLSIFLVMLMWTLDKFVNPEHAVRIFEHFYYIPGLGTTVVYTLAALELIILVGFMLGLFKKFTYGAVLIFHSVSTLSSFKQYFSPFESGHLLFFAAWPMLAACVALFLLREFDHKLTLRKPMQLSSH
jgi:putative oxidoreductase